MLESSEEDASHERTSLHQNNLVRQWVSELDLHLSDFSDAETEPPVTGVPLSVFKNAGYEIDLALLSEKGWMKYHNAPEGSSQQHVFTPAFRSDKRRRGPYFKDKKKRKEREERRLRNRTCDLCSKVFARRSGMVTHRLKHAGPRIPCTYEDCSKLFMSKQSMLDHTRAIHLEATFDCEICGKKFSYRGSFRNHKKEHEQPVSNKTPTQNQRGSVKTKDVKNDSSTSISSESEEESMS